MLANAYSNFEKTMPVTLQALGNITLETVYVGELLLRAHISRDERECALHRYHIGFTLMNSSF